MKKISIILCFTLLISLLIGCKQQIGINWDVEAELGGIVRGSQRVGGECTVSVHEKGAFYISNGGLLSYYDYDSDECYVLCSVPNCGHGSEKCAACAGPNATGFGIYGSVGYYLRPSHDTAQWELVCVDIEAQNIEVLCQIGDDGTEVNQWWCVGINEVFYSSGHAWLDVNMYYNAAEDGKGVNATQLLAIDLENGEVTQIIPPLSSNDGYANIRWEFFNENYACVYMLHYQETFLSMDEYRMQHQNATDAEYLAYLDQFFAEHVQYLRHILIDIDTMEQTVVRETAFDHAERLAWMNESEPVFWISESLGDGKYNDRFVNLTSEGILSEQGFVTGNGLTGWYVGGILTKYSDDSYLYEMDTDSETCQMWRYRIDSGESVYLFDFENDQRFNLFGQTSDKLVGMLNGNTQYAWIYKSDYEKGNFDALHRFSLS